MTLVATALPRTARALPVPPGSGGMAISLLLHALGAAGLMALSFSAPRTPPPAQVIELVARPRPASPTVPVPPPKAPSPAPTHQPPRAAPARSLPQPAPSAPASVRDENAIAQADTLAAPAPDTALTQVVPREVHGRNPGTPSGTGHPVEAGLKGRLVSITRLTHMPVLTVAAKPEYTAEMKKRNLAGKLKAKVLVDSDGRVKEAEVIADPGFGAREAGLTALRKLEFDPGYADGAPVAVWIPFTFTFEWQE